MEKQNKLKELNEIYCEEQRKSAELLDILEQKVIKFDIEEYLNRSNVKYQIVKQNTYMIYYQNYSQIDIDENGFRVWSKKYSEQNPFVQFFHIEFDEFYYFSNVFSTKRDQFDQLENVLEKYFMYEEEDIKELIEKVESRLEKLKAMNKMLESKLDCSRCNHKYGEHNGAVAPTNYFENVDDVLIYCEKIIKRMYKL